MQRTSFADMQCSIAQTLDVVGERWSPLIIRDLYLGLHRFDELVTNLGISRNLLTQRLDGLLAAGIVERVPYHERPVRHEYLLTDAGRDLVPVLMAVMAWGDKWATPVGGPPLRVIHDSCGAPFTPQVCCSECGESISSDSVTAAAGPGAASGLGTRLLASLIPTTG